MKTHLAGFGAAMAIAFFIAASPALAISNVQVDDFEDGSSQNWGALFVQSVINRPDGGPNGAGDNYLEYSSSGEPAVSNGRMVIPNTVQWSGDYTAAGVTAISLDAINLGNTPLHLRLAVRGGVGDNTSYASSSPIVIAPSTGWNTYTLGLTAVELTLLSGSIGVEPLDDVLADVFELRILSAVNEPSVGSAGARGDVIAASIGLDNITAVAVPEPAALVTIACLAFAHLPRRRQ